MALAPEQYRTLVEKVVSGLDLPLSERQLEQLDTHFELLVHWNQKINLTSIRSPEEIAVRHFEESLFLVKLLKPEAGLLVDVGSGAGFPGLPIQIACPAMTAVLLEPTLKKISFLKEVIRQCGLAGIEARAERLEQAARGDLAGRATLVTLRAVALTPELLADLKRLLAPDGRLALFLGEKDALALRKTHGTEIVPWLPASPEIQWESPAPIPHSERRVILVGRSAER
jgi:16S rRNA (guanine527-N7)-methyltransferase